MNVPQSSSDEANPMNFTENQQGNVVLEKLRRQREDRKFCDVVLNVQNQKFYLHRNVLSTFSPFFDSFLQPKQTIVEEFSITSQSPETFQCFVNYMYTGSIVISKRNVCDLLKLAHRLGVSKLKDYCAEYLERDLDFSNCLAVRDAAQSCNLDNLYRHTNTFILNNIGAVVNGTELLALDADKLDNFLNHRTFNLNSSQILQCVLNWIHQDVSSRQHYAPQLIKHVNFNELSLQYVNEMFEAETLFASSELCFYAILKQINICGLILDKYRSSLEALEQKYGQIVADEKEKGSVSTKLKICKKKRKKKLLRGNPLARLAALRAALLLRRRKTTKIRNVDNKSDGIKMPSSQQSALQCHLCEHRANDTTALEHHLSAVHSRDVTYKCGICGYVCQWNNLYLQHVKGHFPGPPFKCDSCTYTSDKINEVLAHRSVHVDEKSFKCLQCGFRSRNQASLFAHTKCHTMNGDKNGQNVETRSYVCDFCGFSSKYLSHLIAHKRIHTGDIYRCSYPHCKFTAGKKSQLGSHSKSHQGSRPHCCTICGRGFLEKSHLVRHERIHLEEKPFKCHECDYASSRRDKLKEHQARHHGDLASAKVPYKARTHKKQENFHQNLDTRPQPNANNDLHDVLGNPPPQPTMSAYAFPTNEPHVHAAPGGLDFHSHGLLPPAPTAAAAPPRPPKESRHPPSGNSGTGGNNAAVAAAAMILDPRFHHAHNAPYVGMSAATGQQQLPQPQQPQEYAGGLMSLF